tara:strand:- start:2550 stop:3356 length:807 start_codon:yes stop_codon:yes gene_type:complete
MSHWYDKSGTPCYEVKGKNGMKPTTLREARKFGWVPSVSTVWSEVVVKPMLTKWIQGELMEAMWSETFSAHNIGATGGYELYEKKARDKFNQKQQFVMNRGTTIHDHLEKFLSGEKNQVPSEYIGLCESVVHKLKEVTGMDQWVVEKPFAHPLGYGGKVDLHNDDWVVDFKTKEFKEKPNVKKMVYDDNGVQLAAYAQGLKPASENKPENSINGRKLLNLFIDVGDLHSGTLVLEWEHENVERFRQMFNHALSLWQLIKKYNPQWNIM